MARATLGVLLALLCYGQWSVFSFVGGLWRRKDAPRSLALAAVVDRGDALRTLGLDTFAPTEEELKKAYRQSVRKSHPDTPGGSASKLQKVKDAYEYLSGKPAVNVWDEGVPQGAGGFRVPEPEPQSRPRPKQGTGARRELIVGGVVGGTLVSILLATQVVNTQSRDEYLQEYGDRTEGFDGVEGQKKLPPVVARGKFFRGGEYLQTANEAKRARCQILLLGDLLPGAEKMQNMASPVRANAIIRSLSSLLNAGADDQRQFKSITAVLAQQDLNVVARELRTYEDRGADIREPRSPYLFFGGGAVLRFQKDEPEQELLLVPAQRLYQAASDFDPLGPRTLADLCPPNLVVFDLTRQQWDELRTQYQASTGSFMDVPEVDSADLLQSLKTAVEEEQAAAVPAPEQ